MSAIANEDDNLKFVTNLYYEQEIEHLITLGISVFLLNSDCLTTRATRVFSRDEIKHLVHIIHQSNKEVYINLNTMIHESDVVVAQTYLEFLKPLNVDGIIIFDWTYFPIAQKLNMENLLIFQPSTLTTNLYDPWFYESKSIKGMTLAREITLDAISIILQNKKEIELSVVGHGIQPMFYSKRPLIKNYFIEKNLNDIEYLNQTDFVLEESNRGASKYPIYEDAFGTHIFRQNKLESIDEIQSYETLISDFIIERFMMSDDELYDSIKVYHDRRFVDEFRSRYQKEYDSGFYYKQTNLRSEVK